MQRISDIKFKDPELNKLWETVFKTLEDIEKNE